jgi:hypothetical protein
VTVRVNADHDCMPSRLFDDSGQIMSARRAIGACCVYRNGRDSTAFQSPEAELTGSGRRDFAVMNSYALQGDAQVLLVSADEAGLGFSDQ